MANAIDDYCAYYIKTAKLCDAMKTLESALQHAHFEIPGHEHDRIATIEFQNQRFQLPIFAICDPAGTYLPTQDESIELAVGNRDIAIESGLFAPIVTTGGRTGTLNGMAHDLMQTRIWFDIDPRYSLITLDFYSNQRFGETEESPSYQNLHHGLMEISDYCLVSYQYGGLTWQQPAIPEQHLPEEHWLDEVDSAVDELVAHHASLPAHVIEQWPVPDVA